MHSSDSESSSRRTILLILFALSGAAALIYEVIWLQLLQLVIGSSAVSIAVLLGTYMGGMCLGSVFFARMVPPERNPLRVYSVLEIGTGLCGVLVLFGLPLVEHLYTAAVAHGLPNMILRGVACAVCLLPPTLLMGATLPAISRWVAADPHAPAWWGYFYGANIAGGVVGCFAAGFYLLRVHDMAFASYVAAMLNVVVAGVAWACSGQSEVLPESAPSQERQPEEVQELNDWPVYFAIAVSGMSALGAEVVWTRILSLMLGPTVYTFSIILGVFLIGLGIGGGAGSRIAHLKNNPRVWLGAGQLLLCLTVAWAAFMMADSLPYWQGNLNSTAGPWKDFLRDVLRCATAVLPAALLWGASFPLALASIRSDEADPARLVGRVYGANTLGAIAGALLFSLVFIPTLGTHGSQQLLIAVSAMAGLAVLEAVISRSNVKLRGLKLTAAVAVAGLLAWSIPAIPWMLIGFGRRLPSTTGKWDLLHEAEGINSSAAWSRWEGGTTYFHVSGKVEASTEPQDMSLQRMLGHLPALLHAGPRSVLIVGFGAGVTAGTFVVHPEVKHITICEIEPVIPPNSDRYFGNENHHVLHDPRTSIVFDDARHFVLTSPGRYDIITSDPIHPWVKGMASLYTTEYFDLCKRHLNPGGIVTQWVPLYESSVEAVRSEIATFFEAFPNGTIWGNVNTDGEGYDLVLMGQAEPLRIDVNRVQARLDRPENGAIRQSLREAGYSSALDLLSTYAAQASDLRAWMQNAQINRDRNLRLQYLAGFGLNTNAAGVIFDQLMNPAVFPDNLVVGSPESRAALKTLFHRRHF